MRDYTRSSARADLGKLCGFPRGPRPAIPALKPGAYPAGRCRRPVACSCLGRSSTGRRQRAEASRSWGHPRRLGLAVPRRTRPERPELQKQRQGLRKPRVLEYFGLRSILHAAASTSACHSLSQQRKKPLGVTSERSSEGPVWDAGRRQELSTKACGE